MKPPEFMVALGGTTFAESSQRVDKLAKLHAAMRGAPGLIVTGGHWTLNRQNKSPMAERMRSYAINWYGVAEADIAALTGPRDTIGDALAVKHFMRQVGAFTLGVVTTETHGPRASRIFRHVLGPEYDIAFYNAGVFSDRAYQGLHEFLGNRLAEIVFRGTEPGQDEIIMERVLALVPGYTKAGTPAIVSNHLRDRLGMPLRQFEPAVQLTAQAA